MLAARVILRQNPVDATPYRASTCAHSSSCAVRLGKAFVQRIALPAIRLNIAILHYDFQRVAKTLSLQ